MLSLMCDPLSALRPLICSQFDVRPLICSSLCNCDSKIPLSKQLENYLNQLGATHPWNAPNWNELPASEQQWEDFSREHPLEAWIARFLYSLPDGSAATRPVMIQR